MMLIRRLVRESKGACYVDGGATAGTNFVLALCHCNKIPEIITLLTRKDRFDSVSEGLVCGCLTLGFRYVCWPTVCHGGSE